VITFTVKIGLKAGPDYTDCVVDEGVWRIIPTLKPHMRVVDGKIFTGEAANME